MKHSILILTNNFPNPSETFILNHITGLVQAGYKVTVVGKSRNIHMQLPDILKNLDIRFSVPKGSRTFLQQVALALSLLCYPRKLMLALSFAFKTGDYSILLGVFTSKVLAQERFDIIHGEFGPLGNLGLLLKAYGHTNGPIVTSFRGSDLTSFLKKKPKAYNLLKTHGSSFLPVCSFFAHKLQEFGFPESCISVYYSAIDISQFQFQPKNPDPTALKFVSLGRFVEKKGFRFGIDVFYQIHKRYPTSEFVIAGDGPLRTELENYAKSLGLEKAVHFPGWLPPHQVSQLIGSSDILLGTSLESQEGETEGIPNVLKEAMSLGTLVVAFDHAGVSDLVIQNKTGYLVPTKDCDAMVKVIETALYEDLSELKINARSMIETTFSMEGQTKTIHSIYEDLLNRQ